MLSTFKRVIANGVSFDYDESRSDSDCKAHAAQVMGVDAADLSIELHNHNPLGYCNPCLTPDELDESHALAYLNRDGDLAVPVSRYGRSTYECSPVAYRAALTVQDANGDPIDEDLLDSMMALVVNDSDEIAGLIDWKD